MIELNGQHISNKTDFKKLKPTIHKPVCDVAKRNVLIG